MTVQIMSKDGKRVICVANEKRLEMIASMSTPRKPKANKKGK